MRPGSVVSVICLLGFAMATAQLAVAQETINYASISGWVTDPQGAAAPGAQVTNRRNVVTVNGNFGSGAYPTNPSSNFGQVTGINDPRATQFAVRFRF